MKRKTCKKLMEQAKIILRERGQKAFETAKNTVLKEKIKYKPVYEALRYFMEEGWYDFQHPALLSLACEAVGGNPDETNQIGAAMVLMAGAADIHDDIIDKSETKASKLTVFGKFGKDIALLAGDALLFEGLSLLQDACEDLPKKQRKVILKLSKQAFFEIGSAEAKETSFKGKYDLAAEEYRNLIELKVAVAEANTRIGAILGGGTPEEIDALGRYGRSLGILMTIRDEFIDTFEPNELKNRAKNECLPLPVLYVFQNSAVKKRITPLLQKKEITEEDSNKIVNIIFETKEIQNLKGEIKEVFRKASAEIRTVKCSVRPVLKLLLAASVEDL